MRKLLLVKHSLPEIDPQQPARHWVLSAEGRRRCELLGQIMAAYAPLHIFASPEPKALETAQLAAPGQAIEVDPDLHEHRREQVGFLSSTEFKAAVAQFFAEPERLVFGEETACAAHQRFGSAIERVLDRHNDGNIAVVAHGTVISLFVAAATGVDGAELWGRFGLPAVIVLSLPQMDLFDIIEKIG